MKDAYTPTFDQPYKVGLFQAVDSGFVTVLNCNIKDDDDYTLNGYIRVSAWFNVTFIPLTQEEIAGTAMVALTKQREEVVNEFGKRLAVIDNRIANLRCLPAPSQVSE